ncbi:MAG: response regulator [Myxococcaceae bacterium]|nr:response regulator [Myxococcaceae bacterium]
MHPKLKALLERHLPDGAPAGLVDELEADYQKAEFDRALADKELELVSHELMARDEELRTRATRVSNLQKALARTAQAISVDPGDLAASLRKVTEAACETLRVDQASVWALNDARSELLCLDRFAPVTAAHDFGATLVLHDYPTYADAIQTNRTIVANDALVHPATKAFGSAWLGGELASLLGASVRAQDRVVAVLCFQMKGSAREWNPDEITFAASMADLVSLLFETAARHRAEAEIERQRTYLREVVDVDPNVIYAKDGGGAFSLVNRAAAESFGRPAEELLGLTEEELGLREHTSRELDGRVLASGNEVFIAEESMVDAKGRRRWFQTVKRPLLDADGRPRQVLSVSADITERKRVEEDHQRLEAELRQAQKMDSVGMLAGGIAHDFNNLLTPILVGAQMTLDELPQGSDLAEAQQDVITAARRAKDLTGQLLAFGRKQVLELKDVDLNREIEQAQRMFRRLLPEDIELKLELSKHREIIEADPVQLQQVLLNLVINARDALPNGGTVVLSTHGRVTGPTGTPQAVFKVRDNGTGIKPDVLPKIFEPFFTTKDRGRGTGLGLSTVYGIVKQHKGGIHVSSAPGEGTTFEIQLPAVGGKVVELETPETRATVPSASTILVVEDEDLVRKLVRSLLERAGHRVLSARDGREALDLARKHEGRIALVLSDVVMPGMTGIQLRAGFIELRPDTEFLFMSGHAQDALGADAQRFSHLLLRKPFTPKELLARISEVLRPAA